MGIFNERIAYKPNEYNEIVKFTDAINHSQWLVSEWNFLSDIQDFNVKLDNKQRNAIKNTLLAISQVEVDVKKFWLKLGDRFPKSEFYEAGVTCAESEVRHARAYSKLLEVLNLNSDFSKLLENKAIQGRVNYLKKALVGAQEKNNKDYTLVLALFSIFIENVSLFSQFAIIKSFNKHLNVLKDVDNVVQATQKEELIHALLGVYIIKEIQREYPEWFDEEFYNKIYEASRKSYEAECGIIDWIFEEGELDFISKDCLKEFIKSRFNESMKMIGGKDVFTVNQQKLQDLKWFEEEIYGGVNTDFFHKRPVSYTKKIQSITAEDLF